MEAEMSSNGYPETSFEEDWAFPNIVRESIPGAGMYSNRITDRAYKNGRPKWQTIFLNQAGTKIIAKRPAMELTSKKGVKYVVCRRHDPAERQAQADALVAKLLIEEPVYQEDKPESPSGVITQEENDEFNELIAVWQTAPA